MKYFKRRKFKNLWLQQGFSIIEIMFVVALIATLTIVALRQLGGVGRKGQEKMTGILMKQIKSSASLYYAQEGKRPKSLEDLVNAEVLEEEKLNDAWGNEFEVESWVKGVPVLKSGGADGEFGTEDDLNSDKSKSADEEDEE